MAHTHDETGHTHAHGHSHDHNNAAEGPMDSEAAHQATVVATFDSYRAASLSANQRRRADYYALSQKHRELLGDYNELLREVCRGDEDPREPIHTRLT